MVRGESADAVAWDAITARNMVAISEPARTIKLNVTVQEQLPRIGCLTLIVHGAEDFIVPAAPDLAHQLIPNARLVVIPDSGHDPFIEQPAAFAQVLRSFTNETTLSS